MSSDFDVVVVGAGPFGLSAAAFLKNKGIGVGIFGEPVSFWRDHMPAGMFLRSNWPASHIADPHNKLTLDHFKSDTGVEFAQPIPLQHFVNYGKWFQQKAVPDLHRDQVSWLEKAGNSFRIKLKSGNGVKANRVIIATGIAPFPWVPKEFAQLPSTHVTHSSDHCDLSRFRGQQVLVVGGGQSALDAARILHGFDVKVEVVAKQKELYWVGQNAWLHHLGLISKCLYSNYDVGPAGISRLVGFPNLFRLLPRGFQDRIGRRAIRPAGTGWQRPYLEQVPIMMDRQVTSAKMSADRVHVKLSDGTERLIDHVIVATGYRVDVARYPFLNPEIQQTLQTQQGHPVLGRALESSVPGLHFVGKPAAWSFGPLLNFISGANFASPELLRAF
jgi:cation diffusion facilitator CzcD-associated flavoprotein CzcO